MQCREKYVIFYINFLKYKNNMYFIDINKLFFNEKHLLYILFSKMSKMLHYKIMKLFQEIKKVSLYLIGFNHPKLNN